MLLNVAPNPYGEIPENQKEHLKLIGKFMKQNGEAIYGTRPGPLQPVDNIYGMTCKGNKLYLHVQDMAAFEGLSLPLLPQKILGCQLLDGTLVPFEENSQGITIRVPKERWEPFDTVIQLVTE